MHVNGVDYTEMNRFSMRINGVDYTEIRYVHMGVSSKLTMGWGTCNWLFQLICRPWPGKRKSAHCPWIEFYGCVNTRSKAQAREDHFPSIIASFRCFTNPVLRRTQLHPRLVLKSPALAQLLWSRFVYAGRTFDKETETTEIYECRENVASLLLLNYQTVTAGTIRVETKELCVVGVAIESSSASLSFTKSTQVADGDQRMLWCRCQYPSQKRFDSMEEF